MVGDHGFPEHVNGSPPQRSIPACQHTAAIWEHVTCRNENGFTGFDYRHWHRPRRPMSQHPLANRGQGVMETLQAISQAIVEDIKSGKA